MSSKAKMQDGKMVARQPRRVNEVLIATNGQAAEPLFDSFWRSGELGLLFGEPGAGKSLLAVQLGEALARGSDPMPNAEVGKQNTGRRKRRKVLYVDMVLSDRQFVERYHGYAFSQNLYRYMPDEGEDLFEWVRSMVTECGFKVVVIDDLSMVSRTEDGTRETLDLMRRLRRLTVETGVSILVLADSYPFVFERDQPERGLRRSRALCGVADSVFALQLRPDAAANHPDERIAGRPSLVRPALDLVQTRSRSGEITAPVRCTIDVLETGLLGMEFDPETDNARRELIREIKWMHEERKETFREIACDLQITKSTAQRLYAEWRPEMGEMVDVREPAEKVIRTPLDDASGPSTRSHGWGTGEPSPGSGPPSEWEKEQAEARGECYECEMELTMCECEYEADEEVEPAIADNGKELEKLKQASDCRDSAESSDARESRDDRDESIETGELTKNEHDEDEDGESAQQEPASALTEAKPQASANFPENLQRSIDPNGREIFVEQWDEHRRKPVVWYKRNNKGFHRIQQDAWGRRVTNIKLPFTASG